MAHCVSDALGKQEATAPSKIRAPLSDAHCIKDLTFDSSKSMPSPCSHSAAFMKHAAPC